MLDSLKWSLSGRIQAGNICWKDCAAWAVKQAVAKQKNKHGWCITKWCLEANSFSRKENCILLLFPQIPSVSQLSPSNFKHAKHARKYCWRQASGGHKEGMDFRKSVLWEWNRYCVRSVCWVRKGFPCCAVHLRQLSISSSQLELEEGAVGLGVNHPSCWENPEVGDFLHLERKQDTQELFILAGNQTPSNGDLSEVIQERRGSAHLSLIPYTRKNKWCSQLCSLKGHRLIHEYLH